VKPGLSQALRVLRRLLLVALVAIQFVPVDRSNPPIEGDIGAPPEVAAILRRSCYDCHSHETRWPWYAYVAPASWLLARDVHEGRGELNFSKWSTYSERRRGRKLEQLVELTGSGEMPLWFYLPLHPSAKLSQADKDTLAAWATPQFPKDSESAPAGDPPPR